MDAVITMTAFAEIPAGTPATIITNGKTFTFHEYDIVPIRHITDDHVIVINDWVAVSISDIRVL